MAASELTQKLDGMSSWPVVGNMSIAGKIWLGISLLVAGFALTTFLGYKQTAAQKEMISDISHQVFPSTQLAQQAMATYDIQTKYYNDAVVMGEAELLDQARDSSSALVGLLNEISNNRKDNSGSDTEIQDLVAEITAFSDEAHLVYTSLSGFEIEDGIQEKAAILAERQKEIKNRLEDINGAEADLLLDTLASMDAGSRRQINMSLVMFLSMLAASAAGIALIINHGISRPLHRAVSLANSVRDGDLSHRMDLNSNDEIGQLAQALDAMADGLVTKAEIAENIAGGDLTQEVAVASGKDRFGKSLAHMVDNLNTMMLEVRGASSKVTDGSGNIHSNSQQLSNGASSQAASLEEITASMTELTFQTKGNAESASEADSLTSHTLSAAEAGVQKMKVLTGAMAEINQASEEIAKIIKVIDDIAFQTNLLALNAAVEAARAGKHGKGFAVVAEEVRSLAGRSAKAARETNKLIDSTLQKVSNGTQLTQDTSNAFSEITQGVGKTSELMAEISQASNQQAHGIDEITLGMQQIDQITQGNAGSSMEMASAAEDLLKQADDLQVILTRFKLKGQAEEKFTSNSSVESFARPTNTKQFCPPPPQEAKDLAFADW